MPSTATIFESGVNGVVATSGATEVVVATVNGVTSKSAAQVIKLRAFVFLTSAGSTTGVVIRIRRASLTGTLVGDQTGQTVITAAGDSNYYIGVADDTPGEVANATYVVTVVNTAGSGAGATVQAVLEARVD